MAASTQLSSSVSSTVEKMDGKSVVSRSRLNSSGKINTFNGIYIDIGIFICTPRKVGNTKQVI